MKILMVFYGGGHVSAAIPMHRELTARGHEVVPLALTASAAVMARNGIAHRTILDYVDPEQTEIARYGAFLAERHHTDGKGISRPASIAYLGSALKDLVDEIGEEEALTLYKEKGLNAFMPVRTARAIIARESPDAVVATASPRMEAAMLRASVELGVFSVGVVDLFGILELPWLQDRGHGHMLTVYSERARRRLVDAGRRPETISVVGNPAFDSLADPELATKALEWRRDKGLAAEARTILWAEQPEPGDPSLPRRIRAKLAYICRANGWVLLVRLHPASTDPRNEVIPEGAMQSHAEEALPVVAKGCDLIATMTSTVAMESLLLDKPVIVLKGSQYDNLVDYSEDDGALVVKSDADIESSIRLLFETGPRAQALHEARLRLPAVGGASARVANLLERHAPLSR